MDGFVATLLVCLVGTPADACDTTTAVDVLSHHVANELQCALGWQELAGSLAGSQEIGTRTYVRTLCRRSSRSLAQLPAPRD